MPLSNGRINEEESSRKIALLFIYLSPVSAITAGKLQGMLICDCPFLKQAHLYDANIYFFQTFPL
jgi:hypothetical protein